MPQHHEQKSSWSHAGGERSPRWGWKAHSQQGWGGGGLSARAKKAIFGLLLLSVAGAIGVLILMLVFRRVPPAEVFAYGISTYHNRDLFPVTALGHEDAEAFFKLGETYPDRFHVNKTDDYLSSSTFLEPLKKASLAGKNLVVFLSLQGRVAIVDGAAQTLETQLFGVDAYQPSGAGSTDAISLPQLLSLLRETQARQILLIIDGSRQEVNWPLGILANDLVPQLRQDWQDLANTLPNLRILVASGRLGTLRLTASDLEQTPDTASKESTESEESRPAIPSPFGHFVLRGLQGEADGWGRVSPAAAEGNSEGSFVFRAGTADRFVDTDELYAYVSHQIRERLDTPASGGAAANPIELLGGQPFKLVAISRPSKLPSQLPGKKDQPAATESPDAKTTAKASLKSTPSQKSAAGAPTAAKTAAPPSGPALPPAFDPALLQGILDAKTETPELATQLAQVSALCKRRTEDGARCQNELMQWIVGRAQEVRSGLSTTTLARFSGMINPEQKTAAYQFVERVAQGLQEAGTANGEWPAEFCRQALDMRKQIDELQPFSQLPPAARVPLEQALRELQAAEYWLLYTPQHPEAVEETQAWFAAVQDSLSQVDPTRKIYQKSRQLLRKLESELPQLAVIVAEASELTSDPRWEEWTLPATDDSDSSQPLTVPLPDEGAKDLHELMRDMKQLKQLLTETSSNSAHLQDAFDKVTTLRQRLAAKFPNLSGSNQIWPHSDVAGIWQGYWAIELLEHRGLNSETITTLRKSWSELVAEASSLSETTKRDEFDHRLRFLRTHLGEEIRIACGEIPAISDEPTAVHPPSTDSGSDLDVLWQRLQQLPPTTRDQLLLGRNEISVERSSSNDPGQTRLQVTFKPDRAKSNSRQLKILGPGGVSWGQGQTFERIFAINRDDQQLDFTVMLEQQIFERQRFLLVLTETDEPGARGIPLAIQPLQIIPPFDQSEWRIVLKTEQGQVVFGDEQHPQLWLSPNHQHPALFTHLRYPAQAEHPEAVVAIYHVTHNPMKRELVGKPVTVSLKPTGAEEPLPYQPAAAPPPAAGATPPTTHPGPKPLELAEGAHLEWEIQPTGRPQPIVIKLPITFYSADNFLRPVTPRLDDQADPPRLRFELDRASLENAPMLAPAFEVQAHISPELTPWNDKLEKASWEPDDLKSKTISITLPSRLETPPAMRPPEVALSIAGVPHVYRWEIQLRQGTVRPMPGPFIRFGNPVAGLESLSEAGRLSPLYPTRAQPASKEPIRLQIEINANQLDKQGTNAAPWHLYLKLKDLRDGAAPVKELKQWPVASSLRKQAQLIMDEKGVWQIATQFQDYEFLLDTEIPQGLYEFKAELEPPPSARSRVELDRVKIAIDQSPPVLAEPILSKVKDHLTNEDLKFTLNFVDPQSGIFKVVYGIDAGEAPDGMLSPEEQLPATYEPKGNMEYRFPRQRLSGLSGKFRVLAVATNGAGLTIPAKSEPIDFQPPKSETTGSLRVVLNDNYKYKSYDKTITVKMGTFEEQRTLGFGEVETTFLLLTPGDYEVTVTGPGVVGQKKVKVVAKMQTPVRIDELMLKAP